MEIKCKVHEVGEEQQVTDTFRKRELIVQYAENPQFVEHIKFETTNDRVSILDGLSPGDDITVSFNLRGRPWTNKEGVTMYFNSLVAWKVNKLNSEPTETVKPPVDISHDQYDDDLPF